MEFGWMNFDSSGTRTGRRKILRSTAFRFSAPLRFIALGRVETEIYRVAYTWRDDTIIRIIPAQKANRHERETYYREILA
jgi:uncharacterized DUF497 family protein